MGLEPKGERKEEVVVRWEKLLPRTPVVVLLVERDDSTRQIIAALLRKCGYRVDAISDGLKAWEILKGKVHDIDLVLTEVELPKMSGVDLLTMMMDHDTCKNIPVIMMSSNDSISIVFKCMIKGAADFLVKPIRKNELTNLWQHVWRKQKVESHATKKQKVDFENDHLSIENATDKQDVEECCEKESDAQSSCIGSDLEVESTCTLQNKMELKRVQNKSFIIFNETINQDNQLEQELDNVLLLPHEEINGVVSLDNDIQTEGKTFGQELDQDNSSADEFDMTEAINNQSQHISCSENSLANSADNLLGDIDLKQKSTSLPSLELSLETYPHTMHSGQENDESKTLHHSSSSAFSLYSNNSRIVPRLSSLAHFQAQNKGSFNSSIELSPYQFAANHPEYHGLISKPDDTKFMEAAFPRQEGEAVRCTPIRFIPFPVPVGGMAFDATGSNPLLQPTFYPQSALALWNAMPSMLQGAFSGNPSHQFVSKDFKSAQSPHQEDCSFISQNLQTGHIQDEKADLLDERRHVSAVTGESASECNDNRCHLNHSASTGVCNGSSEHVTNFNISESSARSGNEEGFYIHGGISSAGIHCLSRREAALAKFRLKRKDRCFEKKVRYFSRKRLAEQRPRVKGQFVRQVQQDPSSIEADGFHCESTA